ncbi:MAG: hypothetical protein A3F83_00585 [Candidatus Glassbacteria bacterium RIFCSPLOWO2_12_FULL_58_11]|uniref:C_GCAxxG_C_C family protein n=2 Tax=Candidatus Glassiibacteriota TaxID=1817805 RepID=A0A1F5YJY2_9BACT|nr:MAG: hypothetical protein A2Z86_10900 [Candidatus Glassbacteria bacterium GWA2_58_10]OGG00404.1 MAG: hypothetical protein A3F83_00585 [Candidatus Glassbacteria bacterium RIFCSPLOWO2_12_FULL_58_11]
MPSKAVQAESAFRGGLNCAQAILSTYGPDYGLDRGQALCLAMGLGGGFGRQGEVCGAVSGACLVLGLKLGGTGDPAEKKTKEETYRLVEAFNARFRAAHGSLLCRDLLGLELCKPADLEKARQQGLFASLCPGLVRDAARLLEELIEG